MLRAHDYWRDTGRIQVDFTFTPRDLARIVREEVGLGLVGRRPIGPYSPHERRVMARRFVLRLVADRLTREEG